MLLTANPESRFYSAGNDLSNFQPTDTLDNAGDMAAMSAVFCQDFVQSFIDCDKPIVAAVTGPAMGIAVTTLALCDFIVATEDATFTTNFMQLAQGPEGAASYLFPKFLGKAISTDMLLLGKTVSAGEMKSAGFLNAVYKTKEEVSTAAREIANKLAKYDPGSLLACKRLMRSDRLAATQANQRECANLAIRWKSEACRDAIIAFMSKRQKKPKL